VSGVCVCVCEGRGGCKAQVGSATSGWWAVGVLAHGLWGCEGGVVFVMMVCRGA
jgi:hypothetical protein